MGVPKFKKAKSKYLLYRTSWDWLIPVVMKIGKAKGNGNLRCAFGVLGDATEDYTSRDLETTYAVVVKYIKLNKEA